MSHGTYTFASSLYHILLRKRLESTSPYKYIFVRECWSDRRIGPANIANLYEADKERVKRTQLVCVMR